MTEHLEPIHTSAFKSTKGTYHLLLMDILPSSYSVVKLLQKVKRCGVSLVKLDIHNTLTNLTGMLLKLCKGDKPKNLKQDIS